MERKLVFFTSSVRFGHHKRYQEWFQNKVMIYWFFFRIITNFNFGFIL